MPTDTTEPSGVTVTASAPADEPSDDYRRTVLTLRLVKLTLGVLVSALTLLELVGVV